MFTSIIGTQITLESFLICTAVSLVLGVGVALLSRVKNRASRSLALTLALLPAVVEVVIMLVNGNIGAGLAVAGTFGLVRFRSTQGTAREIVLLFFAVALGLATGMGYVVLAGIFFAIVALALILLSFTPISDGNQKDRLLRIQIPESLDYDTLFDDLFSRYTSRHELLAVKSTNLGTVYELQYNVRLKDAGISKDFLDAVRCRNGNLNVVCGRFPEEKTL